MVSSVGQNSSYHELDGRNANNQTSSQHRGDKNAVSNLGSQFGSRPERGRCDCIACKAIDDTGDYDVDDHFERFLHKERRREVFGWVSHLSHDTDETLVSGESESHVQQSVYGLDESRLPN